MYNKLYRIIVDALPMSLRKWLRKYRMKLIYLRQILRYRRVVSKIRHKDIINVAFLALYDSVWKYEELYKLLKLNPYFNPIVFVCPIVNYGEEYMNLQMEKAYTYYRDNGYKVVKTILENGDFLDIKKEFDIDLVFYTNPYQGLIHDNYYIDKFLDTLTCYVSYNYGNSSDYTSFHNLPLHNLVWRLYAETEYHRQFAKEYSDIKGRNVLVTGYPGVDKLLTQDKSVYSPYWKLDDRKVKRIIWAPHHTIEPVGKVFYSCFLMYYELIPSLAKKYEDSTQWVFKPHPLLRPKLEKIWGKSKTDSYYKSWDEMPNGSLAEGDYLDLFSSSDAMIHDSGSFLIEYLYTKNPVLRTHNGETLSDMLNPFALECLSVYYQASNVTEVEDFVVNVINDDDPLREKREDFYNTKLLPPNDLTASENILNDLINSLYN